MTKTLLEQFADFAASKPADEEYDPWSSGTCAVAQFARTVDPSFYAAGLSHWQSVGGKLTYLTEDGWMSPDLGEKVIFSRSWGRLAAELAELVEENRVGA
jgi:hypothetical protein